MKTTTLILLASASLSAAGPNYQLHEWGTFTTVSGSDGVLLEGLEREEERLPAFVASHYGFENSSQPDMKRFERMMRLHGTAGFADPGQKGLANRPLAGVTVKMETPVIYFHSPEAFHAQVKVGFEGGTISQWYPARSSGDTPPEPTPPADPVKNPTPLKAWLLDFNKPYHGSIEWDVDVLSPSDSAKQLLFKPGDTLGWVRARVPDTNLVRTSGGETEGYLFYRGVGHFDPGLKTTVDSGETLHMENRTGGKIPYLVAFERIAEGGVKWTERRDGLEVGGTLDLAPDAFKPGAEGFSEDLYRAVQSGLAGCGLTDAEAHAMVQTWWNSYFEAPGLRVFWVLPRATTDRILPLEVSPAPAATVRVLVGRSEIFRPRDEQAWLAMAAAQSEKDYRWNSLVGSHRFGKPIQKRVEMLQQRAAR
ncbi:hypothetical protein [Luteolibacter sp. LG18]|uniref:hypothetical protein n=1 Tax=Luteolibacter sp. LG18 TaxID=2819286 RepID=UPI002B3100A2|nr:hypothetical protein llg_01320 [Luteolibacter sp. LG18]